MHAVRNGELCTKDCLCLFVCPTGATDTETGQIDPEKCISGCRLCVDACPSHAISLVPETYPPHQEKTVEVVNSLLALAESKIKQAAIAKTIASSTENPILKQLATALRTSNGLMAEDLVRESGYMLPQSQNVHNLLKSFLSTDQPDDFPRNLVIQLLDLLGTTSTPE